MRVKATGCDAAKIPPASVGKHDAVCAEVYDRGLVQTKQYGKKHKLWLVFQVRELIEGTGTEYDGHRKEVRVSRNLALGPRSDLRRDLEGWRGERLTEADFDAEGFFDLDRLVGVQATVVVGSHSDAQEDGRVYANVASILPPEDTNDLEPLEYTPINERGSGDGTDFPPKDEPAPAPAPGAAPGPDRKKVPF